MPSPSISVSSPIGLRRSGEKPRSHPPVSRIAAAIVVPAPAIGSRAPGCLPGFLSPLLRLSSPASSLLSRTPRRVRPASQTMQASHWCWGVQRTTHVSVHVVCRAAGPCSGVPGNGARRGSESQRVSLGPARHVPCPPSSRLLVSSSPAFCVLRSAFCVLVFPSARFAVLCVCYCYQACGRSYLVLCTCGDWPWLPLAS